MGLSDLWHPSTWAGDMSAVDHSVPILGNIIGGAADKLTGQGSYAPNDLTGINSDTDATRALRNQFTQQFGGLTPTAPPVIAPTNINGVQTAADRGTINNGLNTQAAGAGVAGSGVDITKGSLGLQNTGAGVQQTGAGVQLSGLGGINAGLGAAGDAAQSYRDVLAGKTPSVAELSAQKLLGQGIAAGFGGANSVGGPNRTLALRSAINGAGAAGAQGATQAGIQRAAEQDAARSGLLGAAGALNTGGVSTTGVGTGLANTGAGLANTGVGIGNTGAAVTAGGNTIAGIGKGISDTGNTVRNTDAGLATTQATIDADRAKADATNSLTAGKDDTTRMGVLGGLALGGSTAATDADVKALAAQSGNKAAASKNLNDLFSTAGDIFGVG